MFKFGIEHFLTSPLLKKKLTKARIGLLAHPASINQDLEHSLDSLKKEQFNVTIAFGPQHGMRGDKQDNMIESDDYTDPIHHIPVLSLYGKSRKPSQESFEQIDHFIFDLQDVGCRIYTYVTTLFYIMEACQKWQKPLSVFDRPNPAGRRVEGLLLEGQWQSFVGADAGLILRHGLTVGELALYFKEKHSFDFPMEVTPCQNLDWSSKGSFGWPEKNCAWVNPSPNIPKLSSARSFPGTVLLEGTTLSEGRGTTTPLELIGAPGLPINKILKEINKIAPQDYFKNTYLRPCCFEPTFHKHQKKMCQGLQLHADHPQYNPDTYQPYRFVICFLKALKTILPDYEIWQSNEYEYENEKLAFDLINGTDWVRNWIEEPQATWGDLEQTLSKDEKAWSELRAPFLLY